MMRKIRARAILPIGSLALSVLMAIPAVAQVASDRRGFWHMDDWSWGHMMSGGGLMMILFWGIIIFLVFLLAYRMWPSRNGPRSETAREILEQRFARGEIDEEEYTQRRRAIDRKTD